MGSEHQSQAELASIAAFLRTRSEASFRRLYRQQTPRMLRLAARLTSGSAMSPEDVVQEAWVRAVTALAKFERRSSLAAWLGGFVVNVAREQRRHMSSSPPADVVADVISYDPLVSIDVQRAVSALPPGFRSVLTLHDIGGFTHQEIGTMSGVDPGTSKSQLSRARGRMRTLLNRKRED